MGCCNAKPAPPLRTRGTEPELRKGDKTPAVIDAPTAPKTYGQCSDAEKKERAKMVESQKERYQYSETSNIPDIAMLKELPKEELPTEEWKQAVEKMVKGTVLNHLTDVWDRVKDDNFRVLHQLFKFLTDRDNYNDRPSGIESYDDLMNNLSYESGRELDEDAAFCRYRLAGPNPTMVRPATAELLAKMKFEEYAGNDDQLKETVSTALVEKRLYCVDYDFLRNLPAGQNGGHQKFVVNPIALFALPKDETAAQRMGLDVLCIQCIPGLPSTIFTREDGTWAWKLAKALVNSADGDFHEAVVHLAQTHLVVEAFMVATKRSLPAVHPVALLLAPHFEGTAFINDAADKQLISPGGSVDNLVSMEITAVNDLVSVQVREMLDDDFTFPEFLRKRELDDAAFPCRNYPYREDGLLMWEAVKAWVDAYLKVYYPTDADVKGDAELQEWVKECRDKGHVGWLAKWDNTVKMLADVVAAVIFTGSVQHAAVNFPQNPIMAYTPAFPLAMYQPPPENAGVDEQRYLDTLPPLEMATLQRDVGTLLGGVYYTQLGVYPATYFSDPRVKPALGIFQNALQEARAAINQRNDKREGAWKDRLPADIARNWRYEFMLPEKIPQSINI